MDITPLFADFSRIEQSIGLPKDFITKLIEEDDWSFIIKAHAVVEASIAHMLVTHTDTRLAEVYSRMALGGRVSKLSFAESLNLIRPHEGTVVKLISELRNRLVHNVKFISFDLKEYFRAMPDQKREEFSVQLSGLASVSNDKEITSFVNQSLLESPKEVLAMAILYLLAKTLFQIDPEARVMATKKSEQGAILLLLVAVFLVVIGATSQQKS